MAQAEKGRLNYRCPHCFTRDLDIDMFYDKEKDEYYCIRCQFHGKEDTIKALYERMRDRYQDMHTRFTKFDFD